MDEPGDRCRRFLRNSTGTEIPRSMRMHLDVSVGSLPAGLSLFTQQVASLISELRVVTRQAVRAPAHSARACAVWAGQGALVLLFFSEILVQERGLSAISAFSLAASAGPA